MTETAREELVVWANCTSCPKRTQHTVLYSITVGSDEDEYPESEDWQVVRCRGCLSVSFRHVYEDLGSLVIGPEGEWDHSVNITMYPGVISNYSMLDGAYRLPLLIRKAYQESITAYATRSFLLASIGFRATIEAICNQLEIPGRTLEKRIEGLYKKGYLSDGDKNRLHSIRFLGNDAAHDIAAPKESELRIALEIIDHILNTLYILEFKARRLETIIDNFEDFVDLINESIANIAEPQTINLERLLGRKYRRIALHRSQLESQLISSIQQNKISRIDLGPIQKNDGKTVQYYSIMALESNIEPSEDFPA